MRGPAVRPKELLKQEWTQGFKEERKVIHTGGTRAFPVLYTGNITLDLSSDPVIQIAVDLGKGFPGWYSFHRSLPEFSKSVSSSLFSVLFGFSSVNTNMALPKEQQLFCLQI
jgi:hypothetical protein